MKKENELQELERLLGYEKARQSFGDFVHYMKADYQENWHHKIIIDRLEKLMHEKDKRVMISLAPRHGKSELVSRQFPCYYLGCNPDAEIIAASYSSSLATMFSRDVQRGMDSEKYHNVFPDTVMAGTDRAKDLETFSQRAKRTTDYFEIVGSKGKFTSVGVGGAVTGKGGNLILLDDPVKNAEEADSEVYREKIYDWYTSTLYTRCEKGANILLIMTRWHKDDLAGRLLESMKEPGSDQWEIIELPAINIHGPNSYDPRQVGEALWPDKFPVERSSRFAGQHALLHRATAARRGQRLEVVEYERLFPLGRCDGAGCLDGAALMRALGLHDDGSLRARARHCYAHAVSGTNATLPASLPTAAALGAALHGDAASQALLCAAWAADYGCFAYPVPNPCSWLLTLHEP